MAREERLIRERVNSDRLELPIQTTDHVEYIKDTFINALRDVFSRDPDFAYIRGPDGIHPDWDDPNLGIVITDVFQYEVEFLPAITVRVNGGKLVDVSPTQNQFTYEYACDENGKHIRDSAGRPIPIYQKFSGLYETTVSINIHAWDPQTREQLITRVSFLFKHILRDQLYVDTGVFVQGVSPGGETETPYNNDNVYSQSISLDVLSGWNNRIPLGPPVEAINLQIIGNAARPSKPNTVDPTKEDMEEQHRIDWKVEIRSCPELVLEDALVWNSTLNTFIVTQDWIEIMTDCGGVELEEAVVQINTCSSIRRALVNSAHKLRQEAEVARNNKQQGFPSGNPTDGFKYRMRDGTVILSDNTVIFPSKVTVADDGTVTLVIGTIIKPDDSVIIPNNDYDIDFGTDPFTATSFVNLTAYNFFLILLYVDSPIRESIYDLNKKIDDYLPSLSPSQQTVMEGIRNQINAINEHRILVGKIVTFDRPPY